LGRTPIYCPCYFASHYRATANCSWTQVPISRVLIELSQLPSITGWESIPGAGRKRAPIPSTICNSSYSLSRFWRPTPKPYGRSSGPTNHATCLFPSNKVFSTSFPHGLSRLYLAWYRFWPLACPYSIAYP
jgi:hypothetical protein